jgi:aspartate aminotransferase
MYAGLKALPGFECSEPMGAFYCFPRVSACYGKRLDDRWIGGSMDLAMALLEEAHVATVPGFAFGDDAHLRLSYAISTEQIERSLVRIRALLERLD